MRAQKPSFQPVMSMISLAPMRRGHTKNKKHGASFSRGILTGILISLVFVFPAFANDSGGKHAKARYVRARIIKASYRREASSLGSWRGRVLGQGKTHLFLRFIKNGQIVGKRLIGSIVLDNEPNGVLFSYRGTVPHLRSLGWDIVAFSRKA